MKRLLIFLWLAQSALWLNAQIDSVSLTVRVDMGDTTIVTANLVDTTWQVSDTITVDESTVHHLTVDLGEDQAAIQGRSHEVQFFYEAESGLFDGAPSYMDEDTNQLPVGFEMEAITACVDEDGDGHLMMTLVDFGGAKSADSGVQDGQILLQISWPISIIKDPEAPPCENEEEIITDVILTWTSDADTVVARAQDPDGEGPLDLEILDDIDLMESTEYVLSITATNSIEGEDITEEIMEEADEHMFFFAFTDDLMQSPSGDGNADNRMAPVNYLDQDGNGLPLGLSTGWTSACVEENLNGTFRVVLKHQPDVKSATSGIEDGGTDIDLTFTLNVADQPDAPGCENEEEIITDVILTWTSDADTVVARAQDPDGEGPLDLEILDEINLRESTEYVLSIRAANSIEGEDITEEIMEEADEHMFFFAFTDDLMQSPSGDGNADNRMNPVNYLDQDGNGLPLGLSTGWTSACVEENLNGTFRVVLKHQPDVKSATSGIEDGGTDIDLTFTLNVADQPDAPGCENEEEIITDVILTWTSDGDTVVARAQDPDGEGPLDLEILDEIELMENTTYVLTLQIQNSLEGEDITDEIREEAEEHMFFFAFTEGLFSDPGGDGNADNRPDSIHYLDFDQNSLPLGLETQWTTEQVVSDGTFRVVLKHQPDVKSATSSLDDGGTDIDLTFTIRNVPTSNHDFLAPSHELLIRPNPVTDVLRWELTSDKISQIRHIEILDLFGRSVLGTRRIVDELDVQNLPQGPYILMISTKDKAWVKRFVRTN